MTTALSDMGYCKGQAGEVITDLFRIISEALVRGESVRVYGFGTFEVKKHKGHLAHNAATGENRMLPDYPVVTFRPGENLKDAVKSGDVKKLSKQDK